MALRRISRTAEEQNALNKRFMIAQDTPATPEETEDYGTIQEKQDLQRELRTAIHQAAVIIDSGAAPSREAALALTKLEEALMWGGKAIFL